MAVAFHHGSETERINGGTVAIRQIDGAIIGLVGTAPIGATNEITLCQTSKHFAQFGDLVDKGYTICDALDIIKRYEAGTVYVINVLDPKKHRTTVTDEVLTQNADTLIAQTQKAGLIELTIKSGTTVLSAGKDYTANLLTGEITFMRAKTELKATYVYADPTKVTEGDVRGGIESTTGKRTGFELLKMGFIEFGADAKIVICPQFDQQAGVMTSLATIADKLNAIAYINAPKGTTLSQAVAGRGSNGTINFHTSSDRVHLFYPHVIGERGTLESLATHAAGLRMKIDVEHGYWYSTSNRELKGVQGVEVKLTARVNDVQSETNQLNSRGITTVFNSYGTGYRLWGNRLAAYPTSTHISQFEVVQRTADLIDEGIAQAELQYVDRPIDEALLDSLLGTIETYMGTLKSIVGYSVSLDPDADLLDAFSQGLVPLQYDFTPKIPAERIRNKSVVTRKYLVNLTSRGGQ
ncbi:phage tail sheath family protein [Pasteurella bettyae]|uniref:Phage tail sheath protein n=1 Tax=Pasteurella bettyae CCUG 2042 TaxID=1095749 RepID=I3D8W4_9PAST|nr:phage tail sheath subtilisin-like domain-containing protein [Pasteurella bettyae]EIJ68157.1 phage tail sheath protein [Pasteurella bettyae CCUG 2042]SUB22557.1 Phage tail sheath protein [Pasteurella bettyae]